MHIGFIGLGAMGKPMAKNLVHAYKLSVNDIIEPAIEELVGMGATRCASPRDIALNTDVIITMLPNASIVENVLCSSNGVFAGVKEGQIIIDMSSVAPHSTRKMAKIAMEKGVKYIDAPVSGGVVGAEGGTLTIMVGGDKDTVQKIQPILDTLGKNIYHVGEVGSGDAVKIVNNLLLGANMAAVAEALVLGVKAGLKPETMYEIIKSSSGRSYALEAKMPKFILKGNFAQGFAVDLQYKDLDLAIDTAKNLGVPMPVTNTAQQVFEMARAKGLGREDISAIIKVWEELLGVNVRGDDLE